MTNQEGLIPGMPGPALHALAPDLYRFHDTCHVYILRCGREAILIDFGSGDVLSHLPTIGIERVAAVLITHHHRDQCQGLALAARAGVPIWVPHAEQDLFSAVEAHWQARELYANYNVRQDRFSLLEPVPIAGTLRDYESYLLAGRQLTVIPTPGHTPGSLCLLAELDGQRIAFTGDLIAAPGKVWGLAATQWTYNGAEGVAASIASLLDLKDRCPAVLLPSHGESIAPAAPAIDLLVERLWRLLEARGQNAHLLSLRQQPFQALSPHLLRNRTSVANSYVLLSHTGAALFIDFGYDFVTGTAAGADRASRRPWLYTLPALKRDFGVRCVEAVLPTHFHDDHVAGCNLLREVEGTQVWAAESFAHILEQPWRYDLPCLWYDAIAVDRRLPLEQPIRWHEHTLTLHAQPGHTRYAVAIALEVDGVRVLATGDQYQGDSGTEWNYVYSNRFEIDDYRRAAELYRRLAPDLILSGHWEPLWVPPGYLDTLVARGAMLEELHRDLLPLDTIDPGAGGFCGRMEPYQATVRAGESAAFEVGVRNPFPGEQEAIVRLVVPAGWAVDRAEIRLRLGPGDMAIAAFRVTPPPVAARRTRIAADLYVGGHHLGQHAEALVTVI